MAVHCNTDFHSENWLSFWKSMRDFQALIVWKRFQEPDRDNTGSPWIMVPGALNRIGYCEISILLGGAQLELTPLCQAWTLNPLAYHPLALFPFSSRLPPPTFWRGVGSGVVKMGKYRSSWWESFGKDINSSDQSGQQSYLKVPLCKFEFFLYSL